MTPPVLLYASVFLAAAVLPAPGQWVKEIEIRSELTVPGKMDFTVRLLPRKTQMVDRLSFACVYHQEFPWEDIRGRKSIKVHEPVAFTYRRRKVKLVQDLDTYISFRVPMDRKKLEATYGRQTFNDDHEITIERMRISAFVQDRKLWSHETANTHLGAEPVVAGY